MPPSEEVRRFVVQPVIVTHGSAVQRHRSGQRDDAQRSGDHRPAALPRAGGDEEPAETDHREQHESEADPSSEEIEFHGTHLTFENVVPTLRPTCIDDKVGRFSSRRPG